MATRWATARTAGYASLTVVGLVAALVIGRPEPALLAAPFALFLAAGLALVPQPSAAPIALALEPDRLVEGDDAELTVSTTPGAEVRAVLPRAVTLASTRAGAAGRLVLGLHPERWGAFRVGRVAVRTTDPLRLFVTETPMDDPLHLRVHPTPRTLRRAVEAAELQRRVGNHTSRARGDGIEFADTRPFAAGDRARSVNWRASARRPPGELWVNDRRPERSADVVLLLDTFGDDASEERWRTDADRGASLDRAVRSLAAVAAAFHAQRDRLGFLTFGGQLRWIAPGLGERALLRVVDGLLDSEVLVTSTWAGVSRVPVGALPPKALLLAVTPLDNDTAVMTLVDLRARGFDVAVIALPAPATEAVTEAGRRLAALQRGARRLRLERLGVAVAEAPSIEGLALAVEEVEQCRRRGRHVRA
jgi:uncharacterized protein (DUF58 family)